MLKRGDTGKPTDKANIEAFNGSFRDKCLNLHWFETIHEIVLYVVRVVRLIFMDEKRLSIAALSQSRRGNIQPRICGIALRRIGKSLSDSEPWCLITRVCSNVASTGLIAEGLSSPAICQSTTQTSPNAASLRSWLVTAMTTISGLDELYADDEITTAGRFLDAVWLVNGNGTRTTSPNLKGIVGIVFGVVPYAGKRRDARCCGRTGKRTILGTGCDEIDEVFDFNDALCRQSLDLVEQRLRIN